MPGLFIRKNELYEYSKGFLYRFNGQFSKLTVCNKVRKPGYEPADDSRVPYTPKGQAGNEEKLSTNLYRAKRRVFELAICNDFAYFCTLTFSKEKVKDRYDLEGCMKSFRKWLNNYNNRKAASPVQYLLIPEQHKDGAWHLHGLFSGLPESDLRPFSLDEHIPDRIRKELSNGHQVFQWTAYDKKFGYCTLSPVRSMSAVSRYITKYVTKELGDSVKELNAHLYYRSQGLKEKELLFSGADCHLSDPDYKGTYASVKTAATPDELYPYFLSEDLPLYEYAEDGDGL